MGEKDIGSAIVDLREKKGFTQKSFAEMINVSQSTLSRWESGFRQPRLSDLEIICDKVGITLPEFFKEDPAKYDRIQRKVRKIRLGFLLTSIALLISLVFAFVPRLRVIDISEPYDGVYGHTITVTIVPVIAYSEKEVLKYCAGLRERFMDYDAIEVNVVKSARQNESEDILYSSTYLIGEE